ncbi:acyl-CoA thioesterase [Mycobacterium sp. AZCC_0083]|uniref:acyl-CoA thioesterase n=1 Tax=Mycobacterium sp. AZCC_0083 TaxID=2735882 RepID=UPI00162188BB|nr:hotdog domain-containing protein [Mycobacterium sp. AZCC_0083]MBB5168352.1 4-hydroxybenzoyl-CoA thioesterase [Mycobacterium sp. AZCC_0083]
MQATHVGHDRWIRPGTVNGDINILAEPTEEHLGPKAACHQTIHRFHVEPVDVGDAGFVDGGTLLEWIDAAAYATAAQWCAGHCVAASVGNLHLDRPIGVGELVELHADLVYTGCSSMHILVTICSSDPGRAKAVQTAQCSTVFVAVDSSGHPAEVPRWTPLTMLDLQRHRQARARARMRRRIEDAMEAVSHTDEGTAPRTALRFRAAAVDANSDGNVRAGRVMRWIDEAAYACGVEWTGGEIITSYIAGIRFHQTVFVGDAIEVTARVIHTGPRSVHVSIDVTTDTAGGVPCLLAHAVVVVVSPDNHGEARPISPWEPACDQDARLDQHARHLIELRQDIEPFTTATTFTTDTEADRDLA